MVKKINPDKPEKPTKAVKPVVAAKTSKAKSMAGGKNTPAEKSFGFKKASGPSAKKHQDSEKPAGKSTQKPASTARTKTASAAEPQAPVVSSPTDEKLQKVLARAGIGSRREMERAIEQGQVKVNDRIAKLGDRVSAQDKIFVNGQRVVLRSELTRRRVILYNKPEGEICSRSDPEGRPTVYDHLPPLKGERWISVGRLDFNTSGLLLFTNDGELANKLMHPSSVIDREYLVRIQGEVTDEMRQVLLRGVVLDDGIARFTDIVDGAGEGKNRWFYCVVMEGRNREVRRLWESQGVKVSRLKRVRYANIFIPSHVRVGQWIDLTDREIEDLCMTAGFDSSTYTRMKVPTRDEQAQRERHDKKLRSASAAPRRVKAPPRKRPPVV
ncbi:RNA pseudouridylate synthase family protein [Cellvibrio sp. BR]|jgi:23S rRNA pseudouridine2605 synthase|nr:RNA pseudouridylate synthase family protein [Cellvibrio sp. BR]